MNHKATLSVFIGHPVHALMNPAHALQFIFFNLLELQYPIDTNSTDIVKFQNCLASYNINQHVHTLTHLHGHILDLILTPSGCSIIPNVQFGEFTFLVLGQFDFISHSVSMSSNVIFQRYHKIKVDSLCSDLAHLPDDLK